MNNLKIANKKQLLLLIISTFIFFQCVAQNKETFHFNNPNTNPTLALYKGNTENRISAYGNYGADCSKYLRNKKLGNRLKLEGGIACVVGYPICVLAFDDEKLALALAGAVLGGVGEVFLITGFITKWVAKRGIRKNNCAFNLEFKGTSVGLACKF